jgi:sugar phosphate isomerase/epimerase
VSHSAFGICYDPGNIIYYTKGELRPETDIDAVASRVTTVIVKDCVVQHGTPDVRVTPGEGLVDFKRVMDGLVASGFDGPLYVECVAGSTLNEINANIESTLRFVRGILT